MNVKNVGNGDVLNVALKQSKAGATETEARSASSGRKSDVALGAAKRIQDAVSVDDLRAEREARIAEIKRQVSSGEYFNTRSVSDIAKVLDSRLGEDVDLERLFTSDVEKE
jgi:anti-sigma28 factor (negative regulator of flagellin synthesis)